MRLIKSQTFKLNIQGQAVTAVLKISGIDKGQDLTKVLISCPTDRGIDLVSHLDLKYVQDIEVNKRLRSESKKRAFLMEQVDKLVSGYVAYIEERASDIKLFRQIIKVKTCFSDSEVRLPSGQWLNLSAVKSAYQPQELSCVSWYDHGIYKSGIKYLIQTFDTIENGFGNKVQQTRFELPDSMLYDLNEIQRLAASESYQKQKLAFFNYGKVQQLLGQQPQETGLSGLFSA